MTTDDLLARADKRSTMTWDQLDELAGDLAAKVRELQDVLQSYVGTYTREKERAKRAERELDDARAKQHNAEGISLLAMGERNSARAECERLRGWLTASDEEGYAKLEEAEAKVESLRRALGGLTAEVCTTDHWLRHTEANMNAVKALKETM
jgi:chromosome segregation ATPase